MADSKLANLLRNDNAWKGDADLAAFNQFEAQAEPWYRKGLPMEGRGTFLPFRDTLPDSVMNQREWALPSIIAAPINALTAPFRAATGSDPTFNAPEEAMNLAGSVFGGGVGTSRAMTAPMGVGGKDLAMNAYHGTPHEIKGGFDLSKVGTGEGAQAYGHGMYFAENPAVAQQYQKDISRSQLMKGGDPLALDQTIGGKPLVGFYESLQTKADRMPIQKAQVEYEKLSFLEDLMQGTQFKDAIARVDDPAVAKWAQSLENSYKPAGNLYKVDIPDQQIPMMLDWDKPLNQQSDVVKKGLSALGITVDEKAYKAHLDDLEASLLGRESKGIKEVPNPSGETIYNKLVAKFGSAESASQELSKLGIAGIRYLDEKSRGRDLEWVIKSPKGGENTFRTKETAEAFLKKNPDYTMIEPKPLTSNFVSFKPETVEILEKNGKPSRKEVLTQQIDKLTE
jgi:hypothetical protein